MNGCGSLAIIMLSMASVAGGARALPCDPVLIVADTTIDADDLQYDGAAVTIRGAQVTIAGRHDFCRLALEQGAVLTHAPADTQGIDLVVTGSLTVDASSRIDAAGLGWPATTGPGAPPVGTNGGGGHGGMGGVASATLAGGAAYGSLFEPATPGSGGGRATGGSGGGVVRLVVADTLQIDGVVTADGAPAGLASHGGGAGGSIHATASLLRGDGTITADGGDTVTGGGGGGGRIALAGDVVDFAGWLSATGGAGAQHGGAGTILTPGYLLIANDGLGAHARTPLTGVTYLDADVQVISGAVLDGLENLTIDGDLTIDADATVSSDGNGYARGEGPGAGEFGGGGGHGGRGGDGAGGTGGGARYDSRFFPVQPGSGGASSTGGAGGGRIRLTVTGTLTILGVFTSNGAPPQLPSHGGGAGGTIRVAAGRLVGGGIVAARGGSSTTGGGGGGGRIVFADGGCFDGYSESSLHVDGGAGGHPGAPGTIFLAYDRLAEVGQEDDFAAPHEPAYPSDDLVAALAGVPLHDFDADPAGGAVATTLGPIAPGTAAAKLAVRVRAGDQAEADVVTLGLADAGGWQVLWSRHLGSTSGTDDPGLTGRPWTAGADTTLVLDLAELPLAAGGTLDLVATLAASGRLDLVVQHHTAVDFCLFTHCSGGGNPVSVPPESGPAGGNVVLAKASRQPNPFNPRTQVSFTLLQAADVAFAIYDVRGRRLAAMHPGPLPAGDHDLEVDGRDLPAGVYLGRLTAGGETVTLRLLLAK